MAQEPVGLKGWCRDIGLVISLGERDGGVKVRWSLKLDINAKPTGGPTVYKKIVVGTVSMAHCCGHMGAKNLLV